MDLADETVRRVVDAYRAAVLAKDVDAFVGLYAPDLRAFDTWGRWSYDGIDAWRAMVTDWFGSLGDARVVVEVADLRTQVADGLATAQAFFTYRAEAADGRTLRAMQNRLTWVLTPRDGAWKIAHEHTSVPLDHETAKGIFTR